MSRVVGSGFALLLAVASLLPGCGGGEGLTCGPGTVERDGRCVVDDDPRTPPPPPPMMGTDAGPGTPPPSGGTDAGGGIPRPPAGSTGCDEATGECAMWAMTIGAGVSAAQMMNGCAHALTTDERIAAVALRHAEHQASVDMLTSMSPEGDLFDQVAAAGVEFSAAGALFSGARGSPDRVVERWAAGTDTNEVLRRCDDMIGVGVATSDASGTSYITVLLAKN